jgi:hypothetical protein
MDSQLVATPRIHETSCHDDDGPHAHRYTTKVWRIVVASTMKVDKLSISFNPDLGDAVRAAATGRGTTVSGWLAEAAREKLRHEELGRFLDEWEAEHGAITDEELARAERRLGISPTRS